MTWGVLLIAHGTVDRLSDLPAFLTNIRRGHPPPPELLHEVQRRYEAIGGQSPLNATNREVAAKLEASLRIPVRSSNRLWEPYPRAVLEELSALGVTRVAVVPLAQHSAYVYADAARKAAAEIAEAGGPKLELACAENWGQTPRLVSAYADAIRSAEVFAMRASLVMTAHSLPVSIIEAGDPYEREVRTSAEAIARELGLEPSKWTVAFQSQGMSTGPGDRPMTWLGPDLKSALDAAAARGDAEVVVAPIGFLADHVEILYDIDIEAKGWAEERGLALRRAPSLNASEPFVTALAEVTNAVIAAHDLPRTS